VRQQQLQFNHEGFLPLGAFKCLEGGAVVVYYP